MTNSHSLLKINVGFIVHQSIGYSRDFPIEVPKLSAADGVEFNKLTGLVAVSRTTEGLLAQVKGQAHTESNCVLCLEPFSQQLNLDFVEMFTFRSHANEETELILPDDLNIDLLPLMQEYLFLDIPISPICKPECKGLCAICGGNLNQESCNHDAEIDDPRLAILKTLLDDEDVSSPSSE